MLKYKITKEDYDKLPEVIKAEYKGDGAERILDVDGVKTQADIDAVLTAKDQAKREQKEAQDALKLAQKTVVDLTKKVTEYEADPNKKLSVTELVEFERTKRSLEDAIKERDIIKVERDTLSAERTTSKIRDALIKAADGVVRAEAISDTVSNVLGNFVISDGKILTNATLGDKSGLDAKAYLSAYVKDRSYLVPASKGGGAGGGGGSGVGSADNETSMVDLMAEVWSGK